jgi:hypothetical protein
MSAYDLLRYLDWFQSYIKESHFGTDEDVANIDLRKDHFLRRQPVDVSEMVWLNDFKLMLLGWLPTLNFPASRKAVLERRYPERLLALLPPHETVIARRDTNYWWLSLLGVSSCSFVDEKRLRVTSWIILIFQLLRIQQKC